MFKELILVVFVDVSQYKFIILWNIAVAPFAGAWIEILENPCKCSTILSLPSRERGLKSGIMLQYQIVSVVAPFAGAWIEMIMI